MKKHLALLLVFLLSCPLPVWAGESKVDQLRVESAYTQTTTDQTQVTNDAYVKGQLEVDGVCRLDGLTITLGTIAYTLPTDNGDAGEQLQTNGSGVLTWESAGAASATALDDIGDPDANGSITFGTYTNTFTGASTAADQFNFLNTAAFGDVSVVKIQQLTGNPTDGTMLEVTAADSNVDGIVVSNTTADLDADGTLLTLSLTDNGDANGIFLNCLDNAGAESKFRVAADGNTTIAGTLNVTGTLDVTGAATLGSVTYTTLYLPTIAAAAAGNVALAIDAAGAGAIGIGATSTGEVTITPTLNCDGDVDIGSAATDTLTITSIIDGSVTLDDGVTDSPSLILQDATNETATFSKVDAGFLTITTVAGDGVQVTTGNLKVGNGVPGVAQDGEDAYVEGTFEVDGATTLDGAATVAGVTTLSGDVVITDQILTTLGDNAEEVIITTAVVDYGADAALLAITSSGGAGATNNTYLERLRFTANGDAQDHYLVMEDNAGDDKVAFNSGGDTTVTLDAGANVTVDGSSTLSTGTGGVLDVDMSSATTGGDAVNVKVISTVGAGETTAAITLDLDDDTAAAGLIYGIDIAASDVTGSGAIYGFNIANSVEIGGKIAVGAANQALVIDADSLANTGTAGVVDMGYSTVTNGASGINLDMVVGDAGAGVTAHGILVDTDDDTATNAATINGISVTSADIAGHATTVNRAFYTSGEDVALQADNGYVRIGTGSTPNITPGDDDLFVEGSAEFDGQVSFVTTITDDADGMAQGDFSAAQSNGTAITNAAAGGGMVYNLPGAAAGLKYTFVVMAAQNMDINPDNADQILGLTNAVNNSIRNATVGSTVTLLAVDATNWVVAGSYGTWTDID
jgi:hypothetical protein